MQGTMQDYLPEEMEEGWIWCEVERCNDNWHQKRSEEFYSLRVARKHKTSQYSTHRTHNREDKTWREIPCFLKWQEMFWKCWKCKTFGTYLTEVRLKHRGRSFHQQTPEIVRLKKNKKDTSCLSHWDDKLLTAPLTFTGAPMTAGHSLSFKRTALSVAGSLEDKHVMWGLFWSLSGWRDRLVSVIRSCRWRQLHFLGEAVWLQKRW